MSNRQFVLGVAESAYVTPSASVIDCLNEGLLCQSGDFTLGGGGAYGEGDINDNGEY